MLLPVSTDAPLYHRPWGTVGVIFANCVVFWATGYGEVTDGWAIQSGRLNPAEWITGAFFHYGLLHLLGNMIFLWLFGMIVEGKLGVRRFLLLYLVLCVLEGFATQLLMLGENGRSAGGASGVVYALMAISLVWAPRNEVEVVWIFFIGMMGRGISYFHITVFWFAMWYIGTDFFLAVLLEFRLSTPVLHCLGAMVGFPVGVLMLRRGWVDCEGWDLFSVREGKHLANDGLEPFRFRGTPDAIAKQVDYENRRRRNPQREIQRIQDLIQARKYAVARSRYDELRQTFPSAAIDEVSLRRLIDGLRGREEWRAVADLLAEYVRRFPERATRARLMQAAVFVKELNRPLAARKALAPLQTHQLSEDEQNRYRAVAAETDRQIAEGVIELQELTPMQ